MPAGTRHSQNPVKNSIRLDIEHDITLLWAEAVVTTDKFLRGAGLLSGSGFPMPCAGYARALSTYSNAGGGSTVTKYNIPTPTQFTFAKGDLISCWADYDAPYFNIWIYKNGASWSDGLFNYVITNLNLANSDIYVTLILRGYLPKLV